MPRVSKIQTQKNRETIEHVSSRLLREQGISGTSVADLMEASGLTHGGFYGHFASKDDLAAIACGRAFAESMQRLDTKIARASTPAEALATIIDGYIASAYQPGEACPIPSLANDVARETKDKPIRAIFLQGLKQILSRFASLSLHFRPDTMAKPDTETQEFDTTLAANRQAMAQLALLVGSITLARATAGAPLSQAFLSIAQETTPTLAHDSN